MIVITLFVFLAIDLNFIEKKSFFCIYYVKKLQNLSIHPTSDDKTRPKFRNQKKKQKNRRIYRTALNNLYYLETFLENVFYIG